MLRNDSSGRRRRWDPKTNLLRRPPEVDELLPLCSGSGACSGHDFAHAGHSPVGPLRKPRQNTPSSAATWRMECSPSRASTGPCAAAQSPRPGSRRRDAPVVGVSLDRDIAACQLETALQRQVVEPVPAIAAAVLGVSTSQQIATPATFLAPEVIEADEPSQLVTGHLVVVSHDPGNRGAQLLVRERCNLRRRRPASRSTRMHIGSVAERLEPLGRSDRSRSERKSFG